MLRPVVSFPRSSFRSPNDCRPSLDAPRRSPLGDCFAPACFAPVSTSLGWWACLSLFCVGAWAPAVQAGDSTQFDVPTTVACRDVTTAEFQWQHPGERLWEARLDLSVLARPAAEGRLSQLLVRMEFPRRALRVVDYAPRTTLASQVQGAIRREHQAESSRTFDFHVRGGAPGIGEGQASGSSRSRSTTNESYEQLPPLKLCVASGTTQRGTGVYFKFQPTPRTTLEGAHELTIWFAAPSAWSGDLLRVRCEAFARDTSIVASLDETVPWGEQDFVTALYRAGDEPGRRAASGVARAEIELRAAIARHRRELAERREGDVVRELAALWGARDQRLPVGWFEQLIYGSSDGSRSTLDRLPLAVRVAADRYLAARRQLSAPRDAWVVRNEPAVERLPPVE